mmetsp:Transcript_70292/g.86250  ORF Transcript_70292/g.86250 Transcript_70292/m.86250 type:complete len:234 (-) Transcript_70292:1264-1965(-)
MVSSDHQNHLNELGAVVRELSSEPQQRKHTSNADVLREDIGDRHATVSEFLSTIIRDGGDEVGRLPDHAQFLCPGVVHRHLRGLAFWCFHNFTFLNELGVNLIDHVWQLVEGVWDEKTGFFHCLVFCCGGLHVTSSLSTSVSKLHLCGEAGSASANAPSNHWFCDAALLLGLNEVVLIQATDFTQQKQHLGLGVVLVSQEVVQEAAARIAITTNRNTFIDSVGVAGHDVVQFV